MFIRYLCKMDYVSLPPSRIALHYVLVLIPALALGGVRVLVGPVLTLETLVPWNRILMLETVSVLSLLIILCEWHQEVPSSLS